MSPEKIWIEQADVAEGIRERFGLDDAISYLVGEKFIAFLGAASSHSEWEAEVPAFAARVREIFEPHELRAFFDRPSDQGLAPDVEDLDAHDVTMAAERMMRVERAKELLLG